MTSLGRDHKRCAGGSAGRSRGRSKGESCKMSGVTIPIKFAVAVLGVASLPGIAIMLGDQTQHAPNPGASTVAPPAGDAPPCSGASSRPSPGKAPSDASRHPHSVTLSWNATVPASNSPKDAIKGYYVYRSLTSKTYAESNRISESPVHGTRCVDPTVEPRKTYFYVVKTLTEGGKLSGSSIEIRAVVPFP
jgi:hypothetical protein